MPAYYSISISIKKKNKYDCLFEDFINILKSKGFVYKSGFWGFEDNTLDEIISWNTDKLNSDFELGDDENYLHDYKQICWNYQSFSEVRLFIFNIQKKDSFSFNIIIPEDDFIKFKRGTAKYDPQVISVLKQLACDIWQWEYVDAIQTSLELSDGDVSFDKIEKGELPSAEPFAIIPAVFWNGSDDREYNVTAIQRGGALIEKIY